MSWLPLVSCHLLLESDREGTGKMVRQAVMVEDIFIGTDKRKQKGNL